MAKQNDPDRLHEHALAGIRRALGQPMEPTTLRRLMAVDDPAAMRAQGVQEAEALGRMCGLAIIRGLDRARGLDR